MWPVDYEPLEQHACSSSNTFLTPSRVPEYARGGGAQTTAQRLREERAEWEVTGDLLLNNLLRGLVEQVQQHAAKVVRVVVRVPQLVRDRIQEKVPT